MAFRIQDWTGEIIGVAVGITLALIADWLIPGGSVFGVVFSLSWDRIKYFGIAIVALIIVLVGLTAYGITKAEGKWEVKRLYDVYRNLIRNKYLNALDKTAYHLNFTSAWHKRRVWSDRFPELLRENIVYLFSLNNYLKRFYIWKVKEGQVNDAEHIAKKVWEWISPLHQYYDNYQKLFDDIHKCRNGGQIELIDDDGNVIGQADVGLFPAIKEFCDSVNIASN